MLSNVYDLEKTNRNRYVNYGYFLLLKQVKDKKRYHFEACTFLKYIVINTVFR